MKRIVLIGDSIRMGYQATVAAELADIAVLHNPQENGGTSANVLSHLHEWVIAPQPDLVHINCGLHDLKKEFGSNDAAVPLPQYEQNIRGILTELRQNTKAVIVWATTTPVDEKLHHKNKPFDRFEADVDKYNKTALRVAKKLGVPVDDLYGVVSGAGQARYLRNDGVHFTDEGYVLLGNAVAAFIRKQLSR